MGSFTDLLKVYWSKSEWTVSNDFSIQDELDVPTGKLLALHNKKETKCCCSYPRDRFWQEWHCHDVYLHSLLQSRILNLDVTKIGMKARYDFNRFSTNSRKFTCVHGRICIDLLFMHMLKRTSAAGVFYIQNELSDDVVLTAPLKTTIWKEQYMQQSHASTLFTNNSTLHSTLG